MNQHLQRGLLLYQQGRYPEAVGELRQHLGDNAEDSFTHSILSLSLNELEKFDEAMEHAQRAIHLAPDEGYGFYAMCCVLTSRRRLPEAKQAILEAIRLSPYDADYFGILASLELQSSRWRESLEAANQGLALEPEHPLCTNLRAQALVQLGDRTAAAATMGEALARRPDDPYTHANQGWALLHAGQPRQALDHFREALRLNPELEWARAGIVESLKARNFVYRWMLAWFLWMSRLPPGARWGLVMGAFFGSQIVSRIATNSPALAPILWPLLYLYNGFVLMTWLSPSFFNLLLRIDRFGRYALSPDQRSGANLLAVSLLGVLACLTAWLVTGHVVALYVTLMMVLLMLPVSAIFVCEPGWPRMTMAIISVVLFGGVLTVITAGLIGKQLPRPLALLSVYVFDNLPLAMIASQFAAIYLMQAKPRR